MTIDELIKELTRIQKEHDKPIECCTYDSIIEDYTNKLCMEIVEDDYYIDGETEQKTEGRHILLL